MRSGNINTMWQEPNPPRKVEKEEYADGARRRARWIISRITRTRVLTPVGEQVQIEVSNPYDATLALHACAPDSEKVERGALLADAAHELGCSKLTKKVRHALNKALNAENNVGRLRTD